MIVEGDGCISVCGGAALGLGGMPSPHCAAVHDLADHSPQSSFPQNLLHLSPPKPFSFDTFAMQANVTPPQEQSSAAIPDSEPQRLFQCSTCKRSFTRADHLTRHVRARKCLCSFFGTIVSSMRFDICSGVTSRRLL